MKLSQLKMSQAGLKTSLPSRPKVNRYRFIKDQGPRPFKKQRASTTDFGLFCFDQTKSLASGSTGAW